MLRQILFALLVNKLREMTGEIFGSILLHWTLMALSLAGGFCPLFSTLLLWQHFWTCEQQWWTGLPAFVNPTSSRMRPCWRPSVTLTGEEAWHNSCGLELLLSPLNGSPVVGTSQFFFFLLEHHMLSRLGFCPIESPRIYFSVSQKADPTHLVHVFRPPHNLTQIFPSRCVYPI